MIKYLVAIVLVTSSAMAQNASQQGQHDSKPHDPPYNDRAVGGK